MSACASLFSSHYGKWGPEGPRPGDNVRISPEMVAKFLEDEGSWLACAYLDSELVGFCSSVRVTVPNLGTISWVIRLVVNKSYRGKRVATTLLYGSWQFSDFYAWGLATANPLAVRALETATRRPCRASVIGRHAPSFMHKLASKTYLPEELVAADAGMVRPKVRTNFHLALDDLERLRKRAARKDRPWSLGTIAPGEEWFACTFRSQPPDRMDEERLKDLLLGADDIWVQAYENMTLDEEHRWHAHTAPEVEWVLAHAGQTEEGRVLDVGCGDGRHAAELDGRGFSVTAVDISPSLISRARGEHPGSSVCFDVADAREGLPEGPYELVLLLYDVLGSSAAQEDDRAVIQQAFRTLQPGGVLVASVMNSSVTEGRLPEAHMPQDRQQFVTALEALPPSRTMQTSGDIFDPQHLLLHNGVYYRKEQFEGSATQLPAEFVVRDRRYNVRDLQGLLEGAGFDVVHLVPVQAGSWDREPPLAADDPRAKELLVVARKPSG